MKRKMQSWLIVAGLVIMVGAIIIGTTLTATSLGGVTVPYFVLYPVEFVIIITFGITLALYGMIVKK